MTEQSFDMNNWSGLWMDAQKKYWDSWLDLSRQAVSAASGKESPAANPWPQQFDLWTKFMTAAMSPESRDWAEKLTDLNKGYLRFGETLWKTLSAAKTVPQGPDNWWDLVSRSIKEMQEGFAGGISAGKDPWAGFAALWGMPMDNWRRVYSACSAMPGDMEKALRSFGPAAGTTTPENLLSRLFAMPTFGYTREWQAETQRWGQMWLEHGEAVRDYGDVLTRVTTRAGELLGGKLQEGSLPETLRAFYNLWVDCGEQAYAEVANSPEFTKAQARLVNTLMAVKRQEQKMVDELLSGLNMPTRRELDTSHRRMHRLQRQVWQLQEALNDAGVRELREEVAALRRELESGGTEDGEPKTPRRTPARAAKPSVQS